LDKKTFTLGVAVAFAVAVLTGVPPVPGAVSASAASHPITWLAAGDSYSSDVGLPHTTQLCGRAVAPSADWATYAWTRLRSSLDVVKPDLVACSGAKTGEFFANQSKGHPAEYGESSPAKPRYDLVTFTFGGDNLGFASIVSDCLIYGQQGGACENSSVRRSISALGVIYPGFLKAVANGAVVKGGNVVVMGYPELLEDPKLWSTAEQAGGACDGFPAALTKLMRGWAGDLNATIGSAVGAADAMPATQRNDVTFTFINPVSGGSAGIVGNDQNLFEPSSGPRHELCSPSGRAWLNGIQLDHPKTKSFPPNQYGEDAMGMLAAEVIPHLTWPWTSTQSATPPPQTAPSWTQALSINSYGNAGFQSVSCPSATFCAAGYSGGTVSLFNGTSWSQPAVVDSTGGFLNSVSCAQSAGQTLCTAVDNDGYVETYDGSSWSSPDQIDPNGNGLIGVSCPTTTLCVTVDADGSAYMYQAGNWQGPVQADSSGGDLWSISCPTSTFCAALDLDGDVVTWDGTSWSQPTNIDPESGIVGASIFCLSSRYCVATDNLGHEMSFSGSGWTEPSTIDQNRLTSIACASTNFCVAVDYGGDFLTFDGATWSPPTPVATNPGVLEAVRCPTTSFCAAVGTNGLFDYSSP